MEKPPGSSAAETRRMLDSATRNDVPHAVAWNRRTMPLLEKMQSLLRVSAKEIPPQSVHYEMSRVNRTGSGFENTAVHGIDAVRFLTGSDYRELSFDYQEIPGTGKQAMDLYISGRMDTGTRVSLHFHPVSGMVRESLTLTFKDHVYQMDLPVWDRPSTVGGIAHFHGNKRIQSITQKELGKDMTKAEKFGFYKENKMFFDAVRQGVTPENDLSSSMQVMEILDCMKNKSARYKKR